MALKKEYKEFQEYTLDERRDIWNTLREALDEAGHNILDMDIMPNLPDDEREYMKAEQFYGITFNPKDFKDVYVLHIINGNSLNAGESIDFDKILEQGKNNGKQEKILLETPMDKSLDPEDELDELEYRLWHSGTDKVDWDALKQYDRLYQQIHGSHFVGDYQLMDNADARNVVDSYLGYLAWNNHGNEAHWMEYVDSLFDVYLSPEDTLSIMEDNGELEAYESNQRVKDIVDMLRAVKKNYKVKNMKNKLKKAQIYHDIFDSDEEFYAHIVELAERYCTHATKIYASLTTDIIWDLPSGNHPGLFISERGNADNKTYTCSVTAWKYLDFPENTPDGKMPAEMESMALETYNKSNAGGLSESELFGYMQKMDAMCAELQSVQKSKTKKDEKKVPIDDDDTVEIEEMDGEKYVEIEPKEEHKEEVETGYEKESDDLNTEDNVTHPDTSVIEEDEDDIEKHITMQTPCMTPQMAIEKCAEFQKSNNYMGIYDYEVKELTGYSAESLFRPFMGKGRVVKRKCSDGYIYDIRV